MGIERWQIGVWTRLGAILFGLMIVLGGCSKLEPIEIGFVGGTSGRVADLGIAGRNGALLAVELRNQAGGVAGHKVELIMRNDEQNPEVAERVTRELIDRGVAAIVGPMTSVIAARMVPIANEAGMLLMSPTVATDDLSHQDDYFFRVSSSAREYATKVAIYQRHLRRVAAAYDLSNQSYTISWLHGFRDTLTKNGGAVIQVLGFKSAGDTPFLPIARDLLATQPDEVLIVANAVDTALLCQQIRKLNAHVPIVIAEWGATEQLIELGGKAVEGVIMTQFFDRNSIVPRYRAFRQRYRDRFDQEPGFAGTAGFDAANVVMDALAQRRSGQSLKEVVQAVRRFEGVQHLVYFDEYGDTKRETFISVVRGGRFVRVE
ncbi:amino acid ABC transporter substrate-binding protein [Candidatus Competibacter phosphatis]|uniref:Amino acid ABC transporter substrate-binding protein n=1 Tax=Candidatus Competibacter phosphatis TaxID=221280 RepID=A0ABX1TGR3_9GAMM|nr:ABC transporter substrate-binding protein [Candidatus Competibacter phosphatis]NMQ18563.1 amino acid ABC transporter substrate-binding protein [Candidatus Competibacter phosphatis]